MRSTPPSAFMPLESRLHLAAVTWDGGPTGLGTDFHAAVNWAGDRAPTFADVAILPAGPGPEIVITRDHVVNGLTAERPLRIRTGTLNTGGLTLNTSLTIGYSTGASSEHAILLLSRAMTVAGAGEIVFDMSPYSADITTTSNGTVVFGSAIRIRGGNGSIYSGTATGAFVIRGEVIWGGSGTGGRLGLEGISVRNEGVIRVQSGTLVFGSYEFPSSHVGLVEYTGGVFAISGRMVNTGTVFSLPAGDRVTMIDGAIIGGTVEGPGGATLWTGGRLQLEGVTLNTSLRVDPSRQFTGGLLSSADLLLVDSLVLNGSIALGNTTDREHSGAFVNFSSVAVSGTGEFVFECPPDRSGWNAITGAGGIFGPGITVRGSAGEISGPIRMQGLVHADAAGRDLRFVNGAANEGLVRAGPGSVLFDGSYTAATLGRIDARAGTITVRGRLDLTEAPLELSDETGSLTADNCELPVLNIVTQGSASLVYLGQLTLPQPNLAFNLTMRGVLYVTGDLVLDATLRVLSGYLFLQTTRSITSNGQGVLQFGPLPTPTSRIQVSHLNGDGTLLIGAGITIRGGDFGFPGSASRVVNYGTFVADRPGAVARFGGSPLVNFGTLRVERGGVLSVTNLNAAAGRLEFGEGGGVISLDGMGYAIETPITLTEGMKLHLLGSWAPGAEILVRGGEIHLGGTFGMSGLASIRRDEAMPGEAYIIGAFDLAGDRWNLGASSGLWHLGSADASGSLRNGTLAIEPGFEPIVPTGSRVWTLSNMTVIADWRIRGNLVVSNGLYLDGSLRVGSEPMSIRLTPGQTIGGTVGSQMLFENSDGVQRTFTVDSGSPVVVAPEFTIRGGDVIISGGALDNRGTISADLPGTAIRIFSSLTNAGSITAHARSEVDLHTVAGSLDGVALDGAGASLVLSGSGYSVGQALEVLDAQTVTLLGSWTLSRPLRIRGGDVHLGGTFTPASIAGFDRDPDAPGRVHLTGVLDLYDSAYTLDRTTGSWIIAESGRPGGIIHSRVSSITHRGVLTLLDGATLLHLGGAGASPPELRNIVLNGRVSLDRADSELRVLYGLTLNGQIELAAPGSILRIVGNLTVSTTGAGSIVFDPGSGGSPRNLILEGTTTLTTGPGVTLRGGNGVVRAVGGVGQLTSNGVIRADARGQLLDCAVRSNNNGSVEVINGSSMLVYMIVGGNVLVDRSTLSFVPGTIGNSVATLTNMGGLINLGLITVSVSGAYTQNAAGTLALDVQSSSGVFGSLTTRTANVAGTVRITPLGNAPYTTAGLRFLTATTLTGQFEFWNVVTPKKNWVVSLVFTNTGVTATLLPRPVITKR